MGEADELAALFFAVFAVESHPAPAAYSDANSGPFLQGDRCVPAGSPKRRKPKKTLNTERREKAS
jgi:hypothetical protein